MIFYGPSGVGTAHGYDAYRAHVLGALDGAFASRNFELDVLTCEGSICGAHGRLTATHVGCYLGAYPTGPTTAEGGAVDHAPAQVSMRLGLHWHIVDGKALDGYMMHDAPALFRDHFGVDLLARATSSEPLPPPCAAVPPTALELPTLAGKQTPSTAASGIGGVSELGGLGLVVLGAISALAVARVLGRRVFARSASSLAAPLLDPNAAVTTVGDEL